MEYSTFCSILLAETALKIKSTKMYNFKNIYLVTLGDSFNIPFFQMNFFFSVKTFKHSSMFSTST